MAGLAKATVNYAALLGNGGHEGLPVLPAERLNGNPAIRYGRGKSRE